MYSGRLVRVVRSFLSSEGDGGAAGRETGGVERSTALVVGVEAHEDDAFTRITDVDFSFDQERRGR